MYSRAVNTVLLRKSICKAADSGAWKFVVVVNLAIPNITSTVNETNAFLCTMWLVACFVGLLLDKRVVPLLAVFVFF